MIQNLLHANVVLSLAQTKSVRENTEHIKGTTKVPPDRKIAIITYLGIKPDKPLRLCFLVRFASPYRGQDLVHVVQEAFGFEDDDLYTGGPNDEYRILVWKSSTQPRNPRHLLHSMARELVEAFVENMSPFAGD